MVIIDLEPLHVPCGAGGLREFYSREKEVIKFRKNL